MKITCTLHAIFGLVGSVCFFLAAMGTFVHRIITRKKVPSDMKEFRNVAQNVRYQTNLFYLFLGIILYFLSFVTGILQGITISGDLTNFILKIFITSLILLFLIIGAGFSLFLYSRNSRWQDKLVKILIVVGFILIILNLFVVNYLGPIEHRFLF